MSGWWTRWRVAVRIARREARRARGRTALVATLVALPVLAGSTWVVALSSSVATDATFSRLTIGSGADARISFACPAPVAQDVRGATGGSCAYDEATVTVPTVAALEARLSRTLGPDAALQRYVARPARAVGADQGLELEYGELAVDDVTRPVLALTAGRLPERVGEVVLLPWAAEGLAVGLGDGMSVSADGTSARVEVVGLLSEHAQVSPVVGAPGTVPARATTSGGPAGDGRLEWFVDASGPVTWSQVLSLNGHGLTVASAAVLADPPARDLMPYHAEGWSAAEAGSDSSLTVYAGLLGIALTEMVLLVGPAYAVGARRSQRALALQGAVGADARQLRRTVLAGALVVGLGSALAGAGLGVLLGVLLVVQLSNFVNVVVPWSQLAGMVAAAVLVSLTAAALPARTAGRLDVLAVLHGRSPATPVAGRPLRAGVLVLLLGGTSAVLGAVRSLPTMTLLGVVAVLLGAVACAPGLLALVARFRVPLPLAGRYALRDALRHRSRTGPALAAVIAAVAGGVTGATLLAGTVQHSRATYVPTAADGSVRILVDRTWLSEDELHDVPARALAAAAGAGPLGDLAPVRVLTRTGEPGADIHVDAQVPPANACPVWQLERTATPEEMARASREPRCATGGEQWSRSLTRFGDVVVDDGTLVRATRLPGSAAAADAVARGEALVSNPLLLQPDGTVRLTVLVDGEQATELVLRAHVFRVSFTDRPLLPATALPDLAPSGLTAVVVGALAQPSRALTGAELAATRQAVADMAGPAPSEVGSAGMDLPPPDRMLLAGVGIALALALAAAWIAVGLAAADQQPDLATLAAVGAEPAWRRRLAGAHAAVLAGAGTVLGALVGVLLGAAVTLGRRGVYPDLDPAWTLQVPWAALAAITVGLPVLAAAGVMAATPSRVSMVRRRAG